MERRAFVKSGALALVTMGLSPSFLRRTAFGMDLFNAPKGKVLICLFQRGAPATLDSFPRRLVDAANAADSRRAESNGGDEQSRRILGACDRKFSRKIGSAVPNRLGRSRARDRRGDVRCGEDAARGKSAEIRTAEWR